MNKDKRLSYDITSPNNNKSLIENSNFSNSFAKFMKKPTIRLDRSENVIEKTESLSDVNNELKLLEEESKMITFNHDILHGDKKKEDEAYNKAKVLNEIKSTIRQAYIEIKAKTQRDFDEIENLIDKNTDESLEKLESILTSHAFKSFYSKEMKSTKLLDRLYKSGYSSLVRTLLDSDPDYFHFDFNMILKLFEDSLCKYEIFSNNANRMYLKEFVSNSIKYNLLPENNIFMIAYFSSIHGFYDEFIDIVNINPENFSRELSAFNNFKTSEDIEKFANTNKIFNVVIGVLLANNYENMAINLFHIKKDNIHHEVLDIAIKNHSIKFLQNIWELMNKPKYEQINKFTFNFPLKENASEAEIFDEKLKNIMKHHTDEFENMESFHLTNIISKILNYKTDKNNGIVLSNIIHNWEYLEFDRGLVDFLFKEKQFDLLDILIKRDKYKYFIFNSDQFKEVIVNEILILICFFLEKQSHLNYVLNDKRIQEIIVFNYMKYGNKIYYGTEMLTKIYKTNWNQDLIKDLCQSIQRTISTKDIMNCHSPILTCVLLCEHLYDIMSINYLYASRLEVIINELLSFSESIQSSTNSEEYIKFLMNQSSITGRSAFSICSENNFFKCLSNPFIGTLVNKMWNGEISQNSLFQASSMQNYLFKVKDKQMDPFYEFDQLDESKSYFFQLAIWKDSCSLRYWPETILTIILIAIYNLFIYYITLDHINSDDWHKAARINKPHLKYLYYAFLIQIILMNINTIFQFIFSVIVGRKFSLSYWNLLEFVLMILSILSLYDIHGNGNDNSNSLYEITKINFETINFVIIDIIVWLRITGVMLTYKNFGPVIKIIYEMSKLLVKYIFIYSLFMICMSAVFTVIFFGSNNNFKDFSTTIVYLILPFVNTFYPSNFTLNYVFGSMMLMVYVFLSAVMLINLLISFLSSVYETISKEVDAAYRCELIKYYQKFVWSDRYGYLIFLPGSFGILNIITAPIDYFFVKNESDEYKQNFNDKVCKIYFSILYLPFIILTFSIYTLIITVPSYLMMIAYTMKMIFQFKGKFSSKVFILIKVIFVGYPFLIYIFFRDIYLIIIHAFDKPIKKQTEVERIKKLISKIDIENFIEFIHSIKSDDNKSLNNIFINYIEYDNKKKFQTDDKMKEKDEYLDKLNNQLKKSDNNSFLVNENYIKNKTNINMLKSQDKETNYISRNLVIIEILENFIIEDNDEILVEIDKMKLLLPKGLEINDGYIERLIYTNITTIKSAIGKLKKSKNEILQFQLIDKILNKAIKIDKDIDQEIKRNLVSKKVDKAHQENFNIIKGFETMKDVMEVLSKYSKSKMSKKQNQLLKSQSNYQTIISKNSSNLVKKYTNKTSVVGSNK